LTRLGDARTLRGNGGSSTIPPYQNLEKVGMKVKRNSSLQLLVNNAIIMALYVVLSAVVSPLAAGPIQFRISESLNHLVVFNRKFIWGVFGGVLIYNAIFGYGIMDVIFGGGQTLLALALTAIIQEKVKTIKIRLFLNTIFFTASMFLIALMLKITGDLPFWPTYATTALSEFIIMALSAPVMFAIDKRLHFAKRM
jgi:uncharacterized membrane protein